MKIPWRRKCQPTFIFLPGKFHGQRSLVEYIPWSHKVLDMTLQINNSKHLFHFGFLEPVSNGEDLRSTPGSGRSPGEGEGHPHQYSCLGNPMDRGAWGARVHGVAKSFRMTEATQSSSIFSDGGTRDVSLSEPQVKFPPGETGLALPHGTSDSGPSSPSPATLQPRGQPCLQHP